MSLFIPRRPSPRSATSLSRPSGTPTARLTITGLPAGTAALAVAVADATVPGTITGTTWTATGPLVGPNGTALPDGDFFLKASVGDGSRGLLTTRVTVVGGGAEPVSFAISAPPEEPVPVPMTFVGPAGWRVSLIPVDRHATAEIQRGATIGPMPILAAGSLSLPVLPGEYTIAVERAQNEVQSRPLTVSAAATVDVSGYFPAARTTQGPTPPSPVPAANGTLVLTGAPVGAVVQVGRVSYTLDASGLPVEISLSETPVGGAAPMGMRGDQGTVVTVTSGGVVRTTSVWINRGGRQPLDYAAMSASGVMTETVIGMDMSYIAPCPLGTMPGGPMEGRRGQHDCIPVVPPSDGPGCGPVLAPLAWMPVRACPGQIVVGPDGRYIGEINPASAGGVRLVLQRDPVLPQPDQTVPPITVKAAAGTSDTTQIVVAVVAVAAGVAVWKWLSAQPKAAVKNPSRSSSRR